MLRIRRLLQIIARPARLLECLEFDPEDVQNRGWLGSDGHTSQFVDPSSPVRSFHAGPYSIADLSRELAQNKLLDLTALNRYHMPGYILSKLTTHFGPADEEEAPMRGASSAYEEADSYQVAFLAQTPKPTKHDFSFQKRLSAGAYGAVWLAKHNITEELVAIKVLKKRDMVNKNFVHQACRGRGRGGKGTRDKAKRA